MAFHYPINGGGGGGGVTDLNGLTGAVTLSAGNNITLNESGNDIEVTANFTQEGKYMISGGITWSGTGLTYDVSFLNYFFNGNKTANPTQVTLAASDPTNNRFDAIVVDELGTITTITGTASANPEVPAIPEDQLQVTIILVAAGSTTPTITSEEIYMDDPTTGWTFSTYTTGTPTGSINFAGTNSPKQGVNDIEASADARLGARFVRGTSFDAFQYTMLQVWVRFTGTAVASNKSLNVRFENSAGTLVANTVNLFNYGLQRGVLGTWQLVVVPITAFGALPATVKGLKVIMGGGTVGQVRQWDIDYMILTNGSVPQANVPTIVFAKDGTNIASQSGINLIEGTGVTIDAVNNPLYNRVDYTINSSGGSSPISVGTSGNTLYSSGFSNTGQGDTTIGQNIFLGDFAGGLSNSVSYSNLLGYAAGYGISDSVQNMNVFGRLAGLQANNSANSNFIGVFAGSQSTNSFSSNFLGADAGNNADQSFGANFIGAGAGSQSENSAFSNFIGFNAGNNIISSYANDSIFIGTGAGASDNLSNYGQISYSSLSGTFTVGESISSSSGGSAHIMFDNGSDLRIANVQGVFNINDTITGDDSGATANLDYFDTSKASILIGNNTSTGDYYNSIAIGNGATNTDNNEMIIESNKGLEKFKLNLRHTSQSPVTFTGSGLDDLTVGGLFTGTVPTTYTVTIDGVNIELIAIDSSTITGGTFAVADVVTNGLGGTATVNSVVQVEIGDSLEAYTYLGVTVTTGTFGSSETIDNGTGVTGTGSYEVGDTFGFTDGTITYSNAPVLGGVLLSNGIEAEFANPTGHTLSDSWTWTYSNVNQNVLDFSNNDYNFKSTFSTDTFGYQISDNLLGFGLKGSVSTYTNVAGDFGFSGILNSGELTIGNSIQLVTGEMAESSLKATGYDLSIRDALGIETSLNLTSNQFSIINDNSTNQNGIEFNGLLKLGNLSGGNGTSITIDDVNEQITISNLPAYDDDAAAGTGGLTAGMVYMTTGSGSAPLNAAGILMSKQ